MSEFEAEFMEQGQLSEDSYTKLEQAGFPRQLVDAYIAGQQALAAQFQNQVFSLVGGKEAYTKMVQWRLRICRMPKSERSMKFWKPAIWQRFSWQ